MHAVHSLASSDPLPAWREEENTLACLLACMHVLCFSSAALVADPPRLRAAGEFLYTLLQLWCLHASIQL